MAEEEKLRYERELEAYNAKVFDDDQDPHDEKDKTSVKQDEAKPSAKASAKKSVEKPSGNNTASQPA